MDKWGWYIKAKLPQARESRISYRSTLIHDTKQDPELKKEWQKTAAGMRASISSQYIVLIGLKGAAMDGDQSTTINNWFRASDKAPHITLLIN